MRIKALLTSLLFASTIAGVASAAPRVRDHRNQQPAATLSGGVKVTATTARPSWMIKANVNYGYQSDRDGDDVQPYQYGQDPYNEGIARNQWMTLNACTEISGHQAQRIDLANRVLRSVEIQATRGDAYIYTVAVVYVDGHQQAFQIKRDLSVTHEPNIRLDLGADARSGVQAIVVDGVGSTSFRVIGA